MSSSSPSSTPSAVFPPGTTVVELVVNDGTVDSEPDMVSITIIDTTPPVVIPPGDISVIAEEPTPISIGTATVTDEVGVVSTENDAPAIFLVGTTVVTWTASDTAGNIGNAVQLVTVQTPEDAAQTMISDVEVLLLPAGAENSLVSKLENVLKSLGKGNDETAANQLEAFVNQVEAQRGKAIAGDDADALVSVA